MEEEDDIAAANILIWMSEAILEEREAIELEKIKMEMKMKVDGLTIIDNNPKPAVHSSVDGTPLPRFPPIPLLNGKIDLSACSMPFEKQLTATDVKEDQNRLSLSKDEVKRSFLPLLNDHERVCQGVPVTTYNPEGKEYGMMFKSWSTQRVYVLNGGWKRFFRENGLVEGRHWVTVWMFRHSQTRKLCFALTWKFIPMDHPCTIKQIRKLKGG
ncbi:putative B3 domain-containing protein At4g03170 [Ipomoea triloba]|uniref:putative B3 domain-containing protein At4g03170 n=1 Tax=Ipomoea triloba TaxID=35885 RepID=UPI00125D5571|nr:putative B3 domain-containing protein At4g03170 [Ipomoea triloba]